MKKIALFLLASALPAQATTVVSQEVADLYGHVFTGKYLIIQSTEAKDVDYVLNYAIEWERSLGQTIDENTNGILTEIEPDASFFDMPVYSINGVGSLEERRARGDENFTVTSEFELRKVVTDLNTREKGFIFINAFSLTDVWGNRMSYDAIEKVIVETNRKHLEIGICRNNFRSAYAVGPTPDELDSIIEGAKSTRLCANLNRLRHLRSVDHYKKHAGKFHFVTH